MGKEARENIKEKLQELFDVIKDEMAEESKEIRENILMKVNEVKSVLEEKWQDIEDSSKDSLEKLVDELDAKALKISYTVQDKYSEGVKLTEDFKQAVYNKWQDIEETVDKMKKELEAKGLKIKYTVAEKVSQGLEKKDEAVIQAADALTGTINKVKCALISTGCKEKEE